METRANNNLICLVEIPPNLSVSSNLILILNSFILARNSWWQFSVFDQIIRHAHAFTWWMCTQMRINSRQNYIYQTGAKGTWNTKFVFRGKLSELNLQIKGGLWSQQSWWLAMLMKLPVPCRRLLSSQTKRSLSLAMI